MKCNSILRIMKAYAFPLGNEVSRSTRWLQGESSVSLWVCQGQRYLHRKAKEQKEKRQPRSPRSGHGERASPHHLPPEGPTEPGTHLPERALSAASRPQPCSPAEGKRGPGREYRPEAPEQQRRGLFVSPPPPP